MLSELEERKSYWSVKSSNRVVLLSLGKPKNLVAEFEFQDELPKKDMKLELKIDKERELDKQLCAKVSFK
ncbi:hypothetical protein B296_00014451 [Ensete ventricosum]|uniref:Uncharacterized protein n=1 Tax=Ensete ventricosum TaxID=4639 RepID=A0A426ZVU5_ENSVE|nr:hypothetical protein B296_00014451 [Ensete ventricosum]